MTAVPRVLVAALLGAALGAVALVGPAGAHGPNGVLGIEVTPGKTPLTADVRVLLEYENDREVAPGATVVAVALGPGGAQAGPTPLADRGAGVYEGTMTMPSAGSWTITVTAENPAASTQAIVSFTEGAVEGDLGPDEPETSSDQAARSQSTDDGGGGGSSGLVIAAAVAVLVAAVVATVILLRRRARA